MENKTKAITISVTMEDLFKLETRLIEYINTHIAINNITQEIILKDFISKKIEEKYF